MTERERDKEWNAALAQAFLPDETGDALHPDTSPETIRQRHRVEVADARFRNPKATPEQLSALLVLPLSIVRRHMGLEPVVGKPPARGTRRTDQQRAKLYDALRRKKVTA
jgi:hypothetical protein